MILDNFPKVLWINLDKSLNRKIYMETLLKTNNISNTRISAINGLCKNGDLEKISIINPKISRAENACTCSHLKAIKYFIDHMTDQKVIIFEDDVSFEFLKYIPFNWGVFEKHLPKDYDLIQLAVTVDNGTVKPILLKTTPANHYYCSAAYLITREGGKKLISRYYDKNSMINLLNQTYLTSDAMISSTGNTYSIPIFTYGTSDSTIHPNHSNIHSRSKQNQLFEWKNFNLNLNGFDADKYFGNKLS